ncbi:MAG: hypothetical protein V4696_03845 [Pseudomonadota bacterium]
MVREGKPHPIAAGVGIGILLGPTFLFGIPWLIRTIFGWFGVTIA